MDKNDALIEKMLKEADYTKGSDHKDRLRKKLFESGNIVYGNFDGDMNNKLSDDDLGKVSGGNGGTNCTKPEFWKGYLVAKEGKNHCPHCHEVMDPIECPPIPTIDGMVQKYICEWCKQEYVVL